MFKHSKKQYPCQGGAELNLAKNESKEASLRTYSQRRELKTLKIETKLWLHH
jgi:hypothetical protein